MRLNPEDRKNWQSFLDLVQPPPGYRLSAAIGTTFGLSMDTLLAVLLSMCGADGEELANNPVAATMAITRMNARVRVLVHPATISGPAANPGSNRFIALLDRLIVQVQPMSGLFHPKLWAMRFEHIGAPKNGAPVEIGRVLVGSRNLNRSTSFELGAAFEGTVIDKRAHASEISADVARALQDWMGLTDIRYPEAVSRLPSFVRRLTFDIPHEASALLRLRWQGVGRAPLAGALPSRMRRALLVAPFVQPDFVSQLVGCTETLQIISLPESLDGLPHETIATLEARAAAQGTPVLYQVTGYGNQDDAYIDGIHAKLLLTEDSRHRQATFVGSANATGPAWGRGGPTNVEAMVEMRPGIGIDRFVSGFIRESKTKTHPWISLYDRAARADSDPEKDAKRQMLAALREVARIELTLRYDATQQLLTISKGSRRWTLPPWISASGLKFSLAPLMLGDISGIWQDISALENNWHFEHVPIAKLTAFVVLRAQSQTPPLERQRFILAKLEVDKTLFDQRDQAIRNDIMITADPAMVLNALVRGIDHVRSDPTTERTRRDRKHLELRQLLAETTLERLLQAVAVDPGLVGELRLLLGPLHGKWLLELCKDLAEVVNRVHSEATA